MKRYSNTCGMMIENPEGGWVRFSDIKGTNEEVKIWMKEHARHANYPDCQIRKTGKCTCDLNKFI